MLDSTLLVPIVTPTKKPTTAVREERKLKSKAMGHFNPVDRRMAKSPEQNSLCTAIIIISEIQFVLTDRDKSCTDDSSRPSLIWMGL